MTWTPEAMDQLARDCVADVESRGDDRHHFGRMLVAAYELGAVRVAVGIAVGTWAQEREADIAWREVEAYEREEDAKRHARRAEAHRREMEALRYGDDE